MTPTQRPAAFAIAIAAILLTPANRSVGAAAAETQPDHAATQPRARDLGIPFDGTPGPFNAITDVKGVEVGYKTLISGEGNSLSARDRCGPASLPFCRAASKEGEVYSQASFPGMATVI